MLTYRGSNYLKIASIGHPKFEIEWSIKDGSRNTFLVWLNK